MDGQTDGQTDERMNTERGHLYFLRYHSRLSYGEHAEITFSTTDCVALHGSAFVIRNCNLCNGSRLIKFRRSHWNFSLILHPSHTHTHTHTHTGTHTHTHTRHTHTHTHRYKHDTHTHTHARTGTHTAHTHTHIHCLSFGGDQIRLKLVDLKHIPEDVLRPYQW